MNKPYSTSSYKADWALQGGRKTAITQNVVGAYWRASFVGGAALIERVRVKNRHDCCGERLADTRITIGGLECGKIQANTKTNQWYEVRCARPLPGGEIQLTTTRADYLQINAVEPYGWSGNFGGQEEDDDDDDDDEPKSFKITNRRATLTGASQASPYGNNGYPADNAFKNKFTHTNKGKNMWWKANIQGGDAWVWRVRVLNRRDCCGNRLSGVRVLVDNQLCGQIPNGARNGRWYTVKCSEPL